METECIYTVFGAKIRINKDKFSLRKMNDEMVYCINRNALGKEQFFPVYTTGHQLSKKVTADEFISELTELINQPPSPFAEASPN